MIYDDNIDDSQEEEEESEEEIVRKKSSSKSKKSSGKSKESKSSKSSSKSKKSRGIWVISTISSTGWFGLRLTLLLNVDSLWLWYLTTIDKIGTGVWQGNSRHWAL